MNKGILKLIDVREVQIYRAFAGQITLSIVLAIFPAILILLTIASYLFDISLLTLNFKEVFGLVVPKDVLKIVFGVIFDVYESRSLTVFSFGFLMLFYVVISLIRQINILLNRIYKVKEGRSFFVKLAVNCLVFVGGLVSTIAAIQLFLLSESILLFLNNNFGLNLSYWFSFWRWPFILVVVGLVAYFFYLLVPSLNKLYWKENLVGASLFSIFWLIMSFVFSYTVDVFIDYGATYGLLSSIILTLVYIQLVVYLFIIFGMVNSRLINK